MSENYRIIKVVPQDVLFELHPVSNPQLRKVIHLTSRMPQQNLPKDWALGVFTDDGVYSLYKQGAFTFDKNDEIVKDAIANHVYFDEVLDFEPAKENRTPEILEVLKLGNRQKIMEAIEKYGAETIKDVASANCENLTQGVVTMLEGILKVQLTLDQM